MLAATHPTRARRNESCRLSAATYLVSAARPGLCSREHSLGWLSSLMYARLTTIVFAPSEDDPGASVFERILPLVSELDGFRGMMLLSGVEERSLVALSLWATEDALEAAQPILEGIKQAETSHRQVETKETARFLVAGLQLPT